MERRSQIKMSKALLGIAVLAAAVYVTWSDHQRRVRAKSQAADIATWEQEGGKPRQSS
jgi:hypothetical protein